MREGVHAPPACVLARNRTLSRYSATLTTNNPPSYHNPSHINHNEASYAIRQYRRSSRRPDFPSRPVARQLHHR
jgi:hypothetical protein